MYSYVYIVTVPPAAKPQGGMMAPHQGVGVCCSAQVSMSDAWSRQSVLRPHLTAVLPVLTAACLWCFLKLPAH